MCLIVDKSLFKHSWKFMNRKSNRVENIIKIYARDMLNIEDLFSR